MARPKSKVPYGEKPWNKHIQINVIQGQLDDYLNQVATCRRRAQIHIAPSPGRQHDMTTPEQWQQEAETWQKKADECRREIAAIEAVPGEWFGPADVEVVVMHITAISRANRVIATQKSDGGVKDAEFSVRFLSMQRQIIIKLMPEPVATRRHQRYIDTLKSFNKQAV